MRCCVRCVWRMNIELTQKMLPATKRRRVGKTGRKGERVPHEYAVRLCFLSCLNTFKRKFPRGFYGCVSLCFGRCFFFLSMRERGRASIWVARGACRFFFIDMSLMVSMTKQEKNWAQDIHVAYTLRHFRIFTPQALLIPLLLLLVGD